jgi:hypothetical protein
MSALDHSAAFCFLAARAALALNSSASNPFDLSTPSQCLPGRSENRLGGGANFRTGLCVERALEQ